MIGFQGNPLPNDKILDVTKLKAFADDKLNVAKMRFFLFDKSRKHCGKRRKCWLLAFSPFSPHCFLKPFFCRIVKSRNYLVKSSGEREEWIDGRTTIRQYAPIYRYRRGGHK